MLDNGVAHGFDDNRQPIGADMRVSINEDIVFGSVGMEYLQHFIHRSALGTASVQFAIGICSRPTLAEAIV